jgi:repressor LexA
MSRPRTGHGLTERQRMIVEVIEESVQRHGYGPTMREIGDAVGLASTSSVSHQLTRLEEKGYLSRGTGQPRTAVIRSLASSAAGQPSPGQPSEVRPPAVPPHAAVSGHQVTHVPLVGQIAAGVPIFADESVEDVLPLPKQLVGEGDLIMLRVVGDSMIGAAIADRDWVVVRRETDIENGDIVAAMLISETSGDGEATVKMFRRSDGHVWLVPFNPAYTPILGDEAKIMGKVVAVLRRV